MIGSTVKSLRKFSAVNTAVNRTLEKNPALRYQSAAELAQALAPFAGAQERDRAQRLVAATPGVLPSTAHPVLLSPTANTLDAAAGQARVGSPVSRSRTLIIVGSLIAVAAIGIAVGVRGPRGDSGASDSMDVGASVHHAAAAAVPPKPAMPIMMVDAGVALPQATVPAAKAPAPPAASPTAKAIDSAVPAAKAPAASPTAKAIDSGVAMPVAPTAQNKLKVKPLPASIDPYGSPD